MRKKFFLYLVCLAVALAIFLWVRQQYFPPGTQLAQEHMTPTAIQSGTGASHLVIETRNPQGVLLYVLRCRQAIPQSGGRYQLDHPQIQFYSAGGQSVLITGDTGDVVVDQLGGALSQKLYPRQGTLSGHPTVTIGPVASFAAGSSTRQPGQIRMRLAGPVNFNYQEGLLTSAGPVRVRGDRIYFNGADLTVEVNVRTKRLNYLQIARGQRLIIRNVSGAMFAGTGGKTDTATRGRGPASARSAVTSDTGTRQEETRNQKLETATHPAAADHSLAVYRLTFGRHVQVMLGDKTLQAHRLRILFAQALGAKPGQTTTPNANGSQSTASETNAPETPGTQPAKPTTIRPKLPPVIGRNDLVVTWQGPLVIRPASDNAAPLSNARDVVLRASGRTGHPVIMHEGLERQGTADVVRYDTATQLLTMQAAAGAPPLTFTDQKLGTISGRHLRYENQTRRLVLRGPGYWRVQANTTGGGAPWAGSWQKDLRLTLAKPGAPKPGQGPAKLAVRRIRMTGDVQLRSRGLTMNADRLQADIIPTSNPKQPQALSSFQALGGVRIISQTPDAATHADRINCDRLVLSTARSPQTGLLEPARFDATGHVRVALWQSAGGTNKTPAQYVLNAEYLQAQLQRARFPAAAHTSAMKPGRAGSPTSVKTIAPTTAMAGHYQVTGFRAWGNLTLRIAGAGRPIRATGYALQGDGLAGTARLTADPAGKVWPVIAQAANRITGSSISLRRQGQELSIPGPGEVSLPLRGSDPESVESAAHSPPSTGIYRSTGLQPGELLYTGSRALSQGYGATWMPSHRFTGLKPGATINPGELPNQIPPIAPRPLPGVLSSTTPIVANQRISTTQPMVQLTWRGHMAFHGSKDRADFYDSVAAKLTGRPGRTSSLTCSHMTIYLNHSRAHGALHLARLVAWAPPTGRPVIADDAGYTPAGLLRTRAYLRCRLLNYDAATDVLSVPVPGHMLLEDYSAAQKTGGQAAQATQPSPISGPNSGQCALAWRHLLRYDVRRNIMTMNGQVRLVYRPMHPLATAASSGSYVDPNAGLILLRAKTLRVQLAHTAQAAGAIMPLGGARRLVRAKAQNAKMELSGLRLVAEDLQFNARRQQAIANGGAGGEVVLSDTLGRVHGEAQKIIWDLAQGRNGITFIQPHGVVTP